jgi:hypothetical protein
MQQILYDYVPPSPTTWVYLSSLIIIAVYFKFRRFWSVRNLDLAGLILLAPGLLMVSNGRKMREIERPMVESKEQGAGSHPEGTRQEGGRLTPRSLPPTLSPAESGLGMAPSSQAKAEGANDKSSISPGRQLELGGYLWIFATSGFFLFRMLVDSAMVRRPLLEPNLSASGLTFACAAMLVFLMSNVVTPPHVADDAATNLEQPRATILKQRGPGYPLFHVFAAESASPAKRATAIIAHLTVVLGMVLIGYRHFDNTHTGIAAATLYLLLPYTANYTPRIDHVVPGALLVMAIQSYRRPVVAGIFVGLAAGLIWYPLFLLPLWCSFYWRRGLLRFSLAVLAVLGLVAASLAITAITSDSLGTYWEQFRQTFGLIHVRDQDIRGIWEGVAPFRWPVIVVFIAMCGSMALWPAQKNLGSLLACSTAVMLGTQFWKAYEGGTYMAWYLPLLILTVFRPNLEDRVALSAVSEGWVKWRK